MSVRGSGRHTISHAENIFSGPAYKHGASEGFRGLPVEQLVKVAWTNVTTTDVDGVAAAQTPAGAGAVTINGALATAGVATLDYARGLQAVSAGAGDTSQTLTITGTDQYGETVVEDLALNGVTVVSTGKAFKTVTAITIDGGTAADITVGDSDNLGLPYRVDLDADVWAAAEANAGVDASAIAALITPADTTSPATAATTDVRGLYTPSGAVLPNGTRDYQLLLSLVGRTTVEAYGVDQFGG